MDSAALPFRALNSSSNSFAGVRQSGSRIDDEESTRKPVMRKWAKRLGVGLVCTLIPTIALLWCVPPAPRLTPENIAKLDSHTTEADAIELFGRPYFKGPFEIDGQNVVWIEDRVLFGVRLDEGGKVVGIRWEKDAAPEGFWHKLRRRLRL